MQNAKRGQITIEFLFIFSLLTILLLYSVRNTGFSEGTPSVENLRIQVSLEEKSLANAISNAISQVYAQGPGSKVTTHVSFKFLKNPAYLEEALKVTNPMIFVTYGPYGNVGDGTYVTVINGSGVTYIYLTGSDKNTFWSRSLYSKVLYDNSSVWVSPNGNEAQLNVSGSVGKYYGLMIKPEETSELRIVVEWNPDKKDLWKFNQTAGEIYVNINPGG